MQIEEEALLLEINKASRQIYCFCPPFLNKSQSKKQTLTSTPEPGAKDSAMVSRANCTIGRNFFLFHFKLLEVFI
jgi:hypothetical protein